MSGGISNLGMGWDVTRNPSTNILGESDYAAQAAAQQASYQQQLAGLNRPQSPDDFLSGLVQQWAANQASVNGGLAADYAKSSLPTLQAEMRRGGTVLADQLFGDSTYGTNFGQQYRDYVGTNSGSGVMAFAPPAPIGGAYAPQEAAYQQQGTAIAQQANAAVEQAQKDAAARQQNQGLQQQAYGQQTGGGFAGGLLNPSYAQPFGNVLGFNGGMMGSGQAPAASTGLNPYMTPAAASSPSTANSGAWGGPFSNKNPWSLG